MQAFTYTPFKARFQFFLRSCRRPEIRGAPLCAFVPFDSRDFLFSPLVAPGVGQWLLRAPLFHVNLVRYAFLPPCARRAAVENSVHSLEEGGGVARAWLIAGTRRLPPFPSSFCGCKNLSCIRREGEKMAVNLARWRLKVDCREEGLSYDVKLNVPFFFFFFDLDNDFRWNPWRSIRVCRLFFFRSPFQSNDRIYFLSMKIFIHDKIINWLDTWRGFKKPNDRWN